MRPSKVMSKAFRAAFQRLDQNNRVPLLAAALSAHQVFGSERVWIDLAFFAVFLIIHTVANLRSPNLPSGESARTQAFTFVTGIAGAGLTAAGVLLALSLAAIGTFAAKVKPSEPVLANIFIADAWLTLSLASGLVLLWIAGYRAHTQNVQNLLSVRLLAGLQLAAIVPAIVRLLIATFALVQS